jgi:hypothetical protein
MIHRNERVLSNKNTFNGNNPLLFAKRLFSALE